ncbi:mechanosensitive ion channel family protein [Thalassotalea euphylliae]|uniref:Mechanosensing system component YbdG n=2 Tax=Thalassotalea euphylliae TaxID=1655234 RepID=A0A3E0TWN1_9GAMM|nr:mechanosensitive ion channel family protein [Thalassotalea euphylliae]
MLGWPNQYLALGTSISGIVLLLLLASISHYIVKHRILVLVQKVVQKTKNTWDDLFVTHQVFTKISLLVPFFLIIALTPVFLLEESLTAKILIAIARVAVIFQIARVLSALLDVIKAIYQTKAKTRYMPLNATIQLVKLAIYLVATILSVAVIIDRSPIFLLSGLGALTAVLLLIFQDTIKGLVASIQIAANKMVAPGDWVELPQYGADGDVLEIGLNTVKIQNFDRTVTTVPTYALISGSFKNWRDMFNSGGRRIKRALCIDAASVRFYQPEEVEQLTSISLLGDYLTQKQVELAESQQKLGSAGSDKRNQRQLTNIGTFRAYITAYLRNHPKVHQQMTCMVRQLAPTPTGIPLELYLFSRDQNWVNYEGIQADIFDHLYAIAPEFGLRIFQHPTGYDWQRQVTQ